MIAVRDLSFRYAGRDDWVLKDINLDIKSGECLLLAGISGCGKSTLTKCLNGLIPHFEKGERAGRVLLDDTEIAKLPMHRIALRVGTVFQHPRTQFFTTNVTDEIAFGCENAGFDRREIRDRVTRAMDQLEIRSLKDREVFSLSDGERQKVILAAIQAMDADILVFDEPSSNLDPHAVGELESLMLQLKAAGKTLIIAEHRLHYLTQLIDRVALMAHGRIQRIYSAAEFLDLHNRDLNALGLRWQQLTQPQNDIASPSVEAANTLTIENLDYRYNKRSPQVLSGIDLHFTGGEITAITGANGSGKTTLAMVLGGLYRETGGRICVNGQPLSARQRIRTCRLVMQEPDHQLFSESVLQELQIATDDSPLSEAELQGLLQRFGLAPLGHCHPHALSGGEKQRLVITTAVAAGFDVLILDEPTSGLDATNMRQLGQLLNEISRQGKVVLVITHDYEFVQTCCTSLVELQADARLELKSVREIACGLTHAPQGAG